MAHEINIPERGEKWHGLHIDSPELTQQTAAISHTGSIENILYETQKQFAIVNTPLTEEQLAQILFNYTWIPDEQHLPEEEMYHWQEAKAKADKINGRIEEELRLVGDFPNGLYSLQDDDRGYDEDYPIDEMNEDILHGGIESPETYGLPLPESYAKYLNMKLTPQQLEEGIDGAL